mmetsp:Transcript_131867/g.381375  ORF Transcript_131867/g.381375 Transcript_131867/m.381375 type:complete len:258 (-) Transcript_131867:422-1195(-)
MDALTPASSSWINATSRSSDLGCERAASLCVCATRYHSCGSTARSFGRRSASKTRRKSYQLSRSRKHSCTGGCCVPAKRSNTSRARNGPYRSRKNPKHSSARWACSGGNPSRSSLARNSVTKRAPTSPTTLGSPNAETNDASARPNWCKTRWSAAISSASKTTAATSRPATCTPRHVSTASPTSWRTAGGTSLCTAVHNRCNNAPARRSKSPRRSSMARKVSVTNSSSFSAVSHEARTSFPPTSELVVGSGQSSTAT